MSSDKHDILFVLGTRPEIIKLAPVIRTAQRSDELAVEILHTGQHYDDVLNETFFDTLGVPSPHEWLGVGSGSQGMQTAEALRGIEQHITRSDPEAVVAVGDTNAVLSAAIAASKMKPQFAHVEAGIRSYDRSMPEEVNRVLADRVTDFAFAPTTTAVENLREEGVTRGIWNVGNTIVDACLEHLPRAKESSDILTRLELDRDSYALATIHRPRNTDRASRLTTIAESLDAMEFPVVFPAHPRTAAALEQIDFSANGSLTLIDPLDYLDFLLLLNHSRVVVTDSGGIQEEASILEVPCLTVRPNTERPETLEAGVNKLLAPDDLESSLSSVYRDDVVREQMTGAPYLYGKGDAGEKIVSILVDEL